MINDRARSVKIEKIKNIIRQNNYRNSEKTYQQCSDYGINVNLNALSRFTEKLELLDRTVRTRRFEQLHLEKNISISSMTYEQVKHRETEITFELGELRVKEIKLMEELNQLSKILDSKQSS